MSLLGDWIATVEEESSSRRCSWSVCTGHGLDFVSARRDVAVGPSAQLIDSPGLDLARAR